MDFLVIVHIAIAIILILLVLVQDSKGAMGSTFGGGGGGSNTLFGATGAENILTKSTKIIVVFFAITCIMLTRLSSQNKGSVLDTEGYRPTEAVPTEVAPTKSVPESTEQSDQNPSTESNSTDNTKSNLKKADDTPSSTEETK